MVLAPPHNTVLLPPVGGAVSGAVGGATPRHRAACRAAAAPPVLCRPPHRLPQYPPHSVAMQAFQLEQLDAPPPPKEPSSPLGAAFLRPRTGVYTGLRPGALSLFDEAYFGNAS